MARRRTTHAGVIDFSAPEDIAIAPTWIFSNLGVEENEFFTARMVHLPKGQYLKLKPKQIDFYKLSQPKEMYALSESL
jgi:ubiquitin fusion degradation protein 1